MKEFIIRTLVDITETKQYRKEAGKEFEYQQQQNLAMLIQTISMRANPLNTTRPVSEETSRYPFGFKHQGTQRVWTFKFYIEYEGAYTDPTGNETALLVKDLNFIPVISGLTETAKFSPSIFNTESDTDCNTIISIASDK